ncbi:MAG: glycoside hydrolase family 6 protein [Myxococcota bacterium]
MARRAQTWLASLALAISIAGPLGCKKPVVEPVIPETATPQPSPMRVANPFEGAGFYVQSERTQRILALKDRSPPDAWAALHMVSQQPVAVWLDRIDAIEGDGGLGLADHLDQAKRQARRSGETAMLVAVVLYNLPDRDCAASASAGELDLATGGLEAYKTQYIDAIATITQDPRYSDLRIVFFVEPDGLPNLVTNREQPRCAAAAEGYMDGVAYAIQRLSKSQNSYLYLDMGHAGWLGWDYATPASLLYRSVLDRAGGPDLIHGFVLNVSNYVPMHETYRPYAQPQLYSADIEQFYEWNRIIDGRSFVDSLRRTFPNHGFVIDTGRSGWAALPDARRDQRDRRSEWCNVAGPGVGERPTAAPEENVHAYFWVKPPGESDGTASPEDPRRDPACPVDAPPAGGWYESDLLYRATHAVPGVR